MFFCLKQQGAGATCRVIDFIDAGLLMHGEPGNQPGNVLRGKKLTTGFSGIGSIVGDKKLVGIAKQIDVIVCKFTEIQSHHTFNHSGQSGVFVFNGITKAVAGGIKISKQAFDVAFRWITAG